MFSCAVSSSIGLDVFFFTDTATTEIYTLSLHDALPILRGPRAGGGRSEPARARHAADPARDQLDRSEEHTSELQSRRELVCRLLLEKKKTATPTPSSRARILAMTTRSPGRST